MARGTVKWFSDQKGYGFIEPEDGTKDIFVHYTQIEGDGFRVLRDGSPVKYDAEQTDKGWHATKVERMEDVEITVRPRRYTRTPRR